MDVEDFDSTLYFLDESEIHQVARQVEDGVRARRPHARRSTCSSTCSSCEGDPAIRAEIIGILEHLFPNLLNARDFRTAAGVLRESKLLGARAPGLLPEHRARLDGFVAKLSEPAIVSQLLQSLDEAPALAGEAEVAEVLRELRASALEPVLSWIPSLSSPALRTRARGRGRPPGGLEHRRGAAHPALAGLARRSRRW